MSRPAFGSVVCASLDRASGTITVRLSDGTVARMPLGKSPFSQSSRLVRVEHFPQQDLLRATTDAGDEVEYDLPGGQSTTGPVGGRPVVYLDQNQWSAVSNALHGGGRPVAAAEREAALRLVELAEQNAVALPASGGHLYETGQRFDADRRYRLGLTVARLSRGLQMRDPVQVRREELHDMFRHRDGDGTGLRMTPVFTLDPDVMFGAWRGGASGGVAKPPSDEPPLPPDIEALHRAVVSATVSIDVLLDADRTPPGEGTGWDAANQRFSDWLDNEPRDAQQKRNCIDAFLLSDLQRDIAEEAFAAGSTPQQMSDWVLGGFGRGLSRLQSAAVYREAVHSRHLNKGTRWKANDLTDLIYLSCAVAYADVIICEKHMAGVFRQAAASLGRPASVHRKLREALPKVETLVAAAGEFDASEDVRD